MTNARKTRESANRLPGKFRVTGNFSLRQPVIFADAEAFRLAVWDAVLGGVVFHCAGGSFFWACSGIRLKQTNGMNRVWPLRIAAGSGRAGARSALRHAGGKKDRQVRCEEIRRNTKRCEYRMLTAFANSRRILSACGVPLARAKGFAPVISRALRVAFQFCRELPGSVSCHWRMMIKVISSRGFCSVSLSIMNGGQTGKP